MNELTEHRQLPGEGEIATTAMNPGSINSAAPVGSVASSELESVTRGLSLGRCFLDARVKRGLMVSDVAQAIKFSPRQIEAIECDDFDKLPGTTFVRGFIRSYAKFLRLDSTPLLAIFDKQVPQVAVSVQEPQDMGAALPQSGSRRHQFLNSKLLLVLSVVFVVAVTYATWFLSSGQEAPAVDPGVVATKSPVVALAQPPLPIRVEPVVNAGEQNVQETPEVQKPFGPDSRQLIFIFEGRSWVEVKDASQHVIFAQNNEPGTRQVINGKPPFVLVIGNASQVQLLYEDRQIDLPPHTRVDVARLSLE